MRLIELVDEAIAGGQKVIIFSFFRTVIEQVILALGNKAIGPITGSVSSAMRQSFVDQFQADKNEFKQPGSNRYRSRSVIYN